MNKNIIFGIFTTLLATIACSGSSEEVEEFQESGVNQNTTISLSKIDSLVLNPHDHMIGRLRESMNVSPSGEILAFVDNPRQQIYLFDNKGSLLQVIGGKGSGPAEFLQISGYFIDEKNRLIVTDESQFLVKIFDLNGELLNTFPLFDNQNLYIASRDIYVYDNILYLQIYEADQAHDVKNSRLIGRYHITGEFMDLIGRYDPLVENSNHYLVGHNFTIDESENILISGFETAYRVQVFDIPERDPRDYFGRQPTYWNVLDERIEPGMPREVIMSRTVGKSYNLGVFYTEDLFLHHFQNMTESWYQSSDYGEKLNFLSIYNRDNLNYSGSIEINGFLGSVTNGKLYIIEDFNPDHFTIGIYEISLD
jgi:hypothetical protein